MLCSNSANTFSAHPLAPVLYSEQLFKSQQILLGDSLGQFVCNKNHQYDEFLRVKADEPSVLPELEKRIFGVLYVFDMLSP